MSYSCADFTDDTIDLLVRNGALRADHIPDNDTEEQFEVVADAILRLIALSKVALGKAGS